MFEQLVLGIIQGIAEWLPISSGGLIVLVEENFFGATNLSAVVRNALFLHLGTFLAALVYFRREVWQLGKNLLNYNVLEVAEKKLIRFYVTATFISGILGLLFLKLIEQNEDIFASAGSYINLIIGLLLLVTAWLQLKIQGGGEREDSDLNWFDSVFTGIAQGFASLPGLSRSGLTVATLLLRNVKEQKALTYSFILSLPIVLAGNIVLNFSELTSFSLPNLVGFLAAFVFGLLTIHGLLRLARKMNFGYFVLFFAILVLISSFV